jgi:hypothetical protein
MGMGTRGMAIAKKSFGRGKFRLAASWGMKPVDVLVGEFIK